MSFSEEFKKQGGCGMIMSLLGVLAILGLIYSVFFGGFGSPENKKFREACWARYEREYLPGDMPDYVQREMIRQCDKELREHLGLKPD